MEPSSTPTKSWFATRLKHYGASSLTGHSLQSGGATAFALVDVPHMSIQKWGDGPWMCVKAMSKLIQMTSERSLTTLVVTRLNNVLFSLFPFRLSALVSVSSFMSWFWFAFHIRKASFILYISISPHLHSIPIIASRGRFSQRLRSTLLDFVNLLRIWDCRSTSPTWYSRYYSISPTTTSFFFLTTSAFGAWIDLRW